MKRLLLFALAVLLPLTLAVSCGEKPKTQEEFRVEYLDMMNRLGVRPPMLVDETDPVPREVISEELVIWPRYLKLEIHVYEWREEVSDAPTYDEVLGLYFEYDEEIFNRFSAFYRWYRSDGSYKFHVYDYGMERAFYFKLDDEGIDVRTGPSYFDLTAEEVIALEEYMINNPRLDETGNYATVLKWLGVERPPEEETEG